MAGSKKGVIVVANETLDGEALDAVVGELERGNGGEPDVHLVCPVLATSGLKQTLGDVDAEIPATRERLEETLHNLSDAGVAATGVVGESDPIVAIGDELRKYGADRILLVSHAEEDERAHSEKDLLDRINREFDQPATELRVAGHGA